MAGPEEYHNQFRRQHRFSPMNLSGLPDDPNRRLLDLDINPYQDVEEFVRNPPAHTPIDTEEGTLTMM